MVQVEIMSNLSYYFIFFIIFLLANLDSNYTITKYITNHFYYYLILTAVSLAQWVLTQHPFRQLGKLYIPMPILCKQLQFN